MSNPHKAPGVPPIIADAMLGDNVDPARKAKAREVLKLMKPEERVFLCPEGYSGRARATFINHGLMLDEQGPSRRNRETKETTMTDTAAPRKAKAVKTTDKPETITAAQAARDANIDGRHFRAFLRTKGMPRQFATKADATKAIRAFQADAKRRTRDAGKTAKAAKA